MEGRLEIFGQAILRRPEVLERYLMTGDADYLLRVVVSDVSAYERSLRDALARIESAAGIKSSFALKQIKYSTAFPLSSSVVADGASELQKMPDRGYRTSDKLASSKSGRARRAARP